MVRHYRNRRGSSGVALKLLVLLAIAAALLFVLCRLYPEYFSPETVKSADVINKKAHKIADDFNIIINGEYKEHISQDGTLPGKKSVGYIGTSSDISSHDAYISGDSIDKRPVIAIVVDDGGNEIKLPRRVAKLKVPLTWAIMPYAKFAKDTADLADAENIPYLLHLPMQAEIDKNGGPYLIGTDMNRNDIRSVTSNALDTMPNAIGINNHRGSLASSNWDVMVPIIDELKKRGLMFLDSRTSEKSIAYDVSKAAGIKSFINRGFLDGIQDKEAIEAKFDQIVKHAQKRGHVIVICHFRQATVFFLEKLNEKYLDLPVRFVTLPEMAEKFSSAKNREGLE